MSTDPNFIPLEDAKNHLPRGKHTEMWGSGSKPYKLQHHPDGAYSCSCPAWRNQSAPGLVRTCKHLKQLRGMGKEDARLNATDLDRFALALEDLPETPVAPAAETRPATASTPELSDLNEIGGVLLAENYTFDVDPTGYYMSEKLDGVRGCWDGFNFYSREGNLFQSPAWFRALMPKGTPTDGELYVGPGKFNDAVSIVRGGIAIQDRWISIQYVMFDLPDHPGVFEDRMKDLAPLANGHCVRFHPQTLCTSREHLDTFHKEVRSRGVEGTMLRKAGSFYERRRSRTLLKVVDFTQEEVKIVGYMSGNGKHKGKLGAYQCVLANGTCFAVGTGISNKEREYPLPIGTRITVKYRELTPAGVPRFASSLGARDYE